MAITIPARLITRAEYLTFLNSSSTELNDIIDYWIAAVDKEIRQYCNRDFCQKEEAGITVYCSDTGTPTAATVTVTETTIVLVSTGGDTAGTITKTFADATDDTLTELVATITGETAWTCTLNYSDGSADSSDLMPRTSQSCLTSAEPVTLATRVDETEYFDGCGQDTLWPARFPLESITSIYDDTDRLFTTAGDEIDSDYYLIQKYADHIEFDGATPSTGKQNIRLIHRAGYAASDDIPVDLKAAACMLVSARRATAGKEHLSSEVESVEGHTFSAQYIGNMPRVIQNLLGNYRRIAV